MHQADPMNIRRPSTTESWSSTTAACFADAKSTAKIARSRLTSLRSAFNLALRRATPRLGVCLRWDTDILLGLGWGKAIHTLTRGM
jgi:hypothetical protein